MGKSIKIGLLGSGTVGSGVIRVLEMNRPQITERVGTPIEIKTVLVRDVKKPRPQLGDVRLTDKIEDILDDPEIDVVVELMGGIHPAREYMLRAMEAGKSVVTANKDVVAQFGKDMFAMAEKKDVDFRFEASVGGGIPIITPLKQCLTANRITEILGIVNGTTNYMLTKMTECGADYDTVLKEAQAKGYAEANPSADVDGLDAARKAAILASLAFNTRVQLEDVSVEGITKITPDDIEYAKDLGYVIKLLAVGKDSDENGVDVRVHPVFLPKTHPLASVNGVFNAIFVRGNAIGEAMFYGQGAGSLPTPRPSSPTSSTSRATSSTAPSAMCAAPATRRRSSARLMRPPLPTTCACSSTTSPASSVPSRRPSVMPASASNRSSRRAAMSSTMRKSSPSRISSSTSASRRR